MRKPLNSRGNSQPFGTGTGRLVSVAGREGFEPSMELQTPYSLSRGALSATQPPARNRGSDLSHYRRGSLLWAGPETVNDRAINERNSARGYSCPGTGRTETARDLKGPGRLSSCQFMSSVSGIISIRSCRLPHRRTTASGRKSADRFWQ